MAVNDDCNTARNSVIAMPGCFGALAQYRTSIQRWREDIRVLTLRFEHYCPHEHVKQ